MFQPTKTERRILAAERTAAMQHVSLETHLRLKGERRAATSGSKGRIGCGTSISANKETCRTCAAIADLGARMDAVRDPIPTGGIVEEAKCLV